MQNGTKKRLESISSALILVALAAVTTLTPYVAAISEPAKVFLLGAALVGLAIWARRYLRRQPNL